MFKYTPKSKIAKTIVRKQRITGYLCYEDARRILQEVGINDYRAISDFRSSFMSTVFSQKKEKIRSWSVVRNFLCVCLT